MLTLQADFEPLKNSFPAGLNLAILPLQVCSVTNVFRHNEMCSLQEERLRERVAYIIGLAVFENTLGMVLDSTAISFCLPLLMINVLNADFNRVSTLPLLGYRSKSGSMNALELKALEDKIHASCFSIRRRIKSLIALMRHHI